MYQVVHTILRSNARVKREGQILLSQAPTVSALLQPRHQGKLFAFLLKLLFCAQAAHRQRTLRPAVLGKLSPWFPRGMYTERPGCGALSIRALPRLAASNSSIQSATGTSSSDSCAAELSDSTCRCQGWKGLGQLFALALPRRAASMSSIHSAAGTSSLDSCAAELSDSTCKWSRISRRGVQAGWQREVRV